MGFIDETGALVAGALLPDARSAVDTSQDGCVEALETPAFRNQLLNTLMRES
jgi:hypothetical protein